MFFLYFFSSFGLRVQLQGYILHQYDYWCGMESHCWSNRVQAFLDGRWFVIYVLRSSVSLWFANMSSNLCVHAYRKQQSSASVSGSQHPLPQNQRAQPALCLHNHHLCGLRKLRGARNLFVSAHRYREGCSTDYESYFLCLCV